MDKNEVISSDLCKENVSNDNDMKLINTFDISKSSRKNSISSDVKSNSFTKSSSPNTPVIKTMLKCVLELADKDLKPQIKAESLSIVNGILGSVSSVLQRQIMRKILFNMGLENILPSLSIYKCTRLNEELKIFENGQRHEESIQLSKSGKHPLNIFSEAYMKLSMNKECIALFMEIIEKIALGSKVTTDDILNLYLALNKEFKKEEISKENENLLTDLLNNNTISDNLTFDNESIVKTRKNLRQNSNTFNDFNYDVSISSDLPYTEKENLGRKTIDVEVQTEDFQEMSSKLLTVVDENKNLKIVMDKTKPPEAPPLPNFQTNISLTKEIPPLSVRTKKEVVNSESKKLLPPPPPPPPLLLKCNGKNFQSTSKCTIKSSDLLNVENKMSLNVLPKYNKVKSTNVVSWTPIKINNLESGKTIWNQFVEPEFSESERNKLELVFEKPQKIPRRLTVAAFGKRPKDCLSPNKNNNRMLSKGLSEKRVLNLGIVLSRFKLKGLNLVEALDSERCSTFDIDLLSNLLLQYPTEEEKKYFQNIDETKMLNSIEAFIWAVSRKPHLKIKLELMVFEANFLVDSKNYIQKAEQCLDICKKLHQNSNIEKFFYKCLQIGNFLNQGNYNGNAYGFTLTSFINILTFKGTVTNKSSSIRIVDLLAESKAFYTEEINNFCDELEKVKSFDLNDFEIMSNKMNQQLNTIKSKVEATESFMTTKEITFVFTNNINICSKLKQLVSDIKLLESDLQKYYCAEKMKIEEIISILFQAFNLLKKANLDKIHLENHHKTQQSFGKSLSKLKEKIVKYDTRKNFVDLTT
uniref:FH2 domain-containing protein n=1 Tax=Strongyloides venezuelensis TaxID=75913 RepID=A0A0K0F825_STRVS